MRIDALLRASAIDQLEARILIAHALQWTRIELVTRSQDELSDDEIRTAQSVLQRRRDGEPIAYITGEREFFGLKLKVTPAVLIPRHETELLVEKAAQHLHAKSSVKNPNEKKKLFKNYIDLIIFVNDSGGSISPNATDQFPPVMSCERCAILLLLKER